jgi:hypothetical protein
MDDKKPSKKRPSKKQRQKRYQAKHNKNQAPNVVNHTCQANNNLQASDKNRGVERDTRGTPETFDSQQWSYGQDDTDYRNDPCNIVGMMMNLQRGFEFTEQKRRESPEVKNTLNTFLDSIKFEKKTKVTKAFTTFKQELYYRDDKRRK